MEASWQSSIDRTLRTTEATLEQLQHRRATYDRAKRKVDDYLGTPSAATPPRPGAPIDLFEHDVSLPPPLPQHLRYRAAHMPAVPALQDRPSPAPRADSRRPNTPNSPLQLVNAQVRGAMLELELEKAKRADSVRELAYRTTAELAEMRSLITQLQGENSALRKSVRALEGRLGFSPSAAAAAAAPDTNASYLSTSSATAAGVHATRTALLASAVANSGFALPHDPASLVARVEALEGGLARQQQLSEDRQTRVTAVLRELVKAEVGADMSQVRALAREAARDSAEEVLKLRLSALQSSTQADLQNALRTAAASETAAQFAQQQCRELEQRLSAQLHRVQTQQTEWQRARDESSSSGSAVAAAAAAGQQSLERVAAVERRMEEQLRNVQAQLRQCTTDAAAQAERVAQQHKALTTAVHAKAEAAEVTTLKDLLDAQLRGSGSGSAWVTRDQAAALIKSQAQPLHEELRKVQQTVQENHENAEAWRRQTGMRFAAVEAGMKESLQEVTQQEQQWQSCARDVQQLRAEATAADTRVADAVRHAKAELAEAWEVKVQLLEERTQQALRERQQHADAHARQLQQALADQQEAQQRARLSAEAVEERLRKAEATLAALEATLPRATDDVRVKCDALQSSMQQTCVLPVTRVQQDLEAVQRTLQSIDDERARSNAGWAQQLTEVKQYYEERARHAREVIDQRLGHQKELYDELRSQQVAQRRTAEEQHQHLLERIAHVQQQQQRVHVVTTTAAAAPVSPAPTEGTSTGAPVVRAALAEEQQAQLQLMGERLSGAEARLDAVESTAAGVPGAIADTAAGLSGRLERLETRLQSEAGSTAQLQQQLTAQVQETHAQVDSLVRRCASMEAALQAHATEASRHLHESLAPVQLATQLGSDAACLQHLALRLQEHLPPAPPDCSAAVAEVKAQVATQASAVAAVEASVKATQDEVTAMAEHQKQLQQRQEEDRAAVARSPEAVPLEAESPKAAAAAAAATVRAEVQGDLQAVQCAVAELRAQQEDVEQRLHRLASTDQVSAVIADLAAVKNTVATSLPAELATLAEQCAALQASQRQQLPTLHKYVQDVVEVVETNHTAQLDPLLLRLRTAEERHRTLQTRVEEGVAAAAAAEEANSQVTRELRQAVEQQHTQHAAAQQAVTSRLAALQEDVAAVHGTLDEVGTRVAAAESAREQLAAAVQSLEAAAAAVVHAKERADEEAAAARAPPLAAASPASAADVRQVGLPATAAAAEEVVEELRAYVAELDERLSLVEEQASDSVSATAETLGAFREQLQGVVGRFAAAAAAAQLGGDAVGDVDRGRSEGDRATSVESAVGHATEGAPVIHNLEDVLLFLLTQLRQLQHALRQLQSNTVDTLEILEQHEESVAPLPMLQHTVDVMAAALVPLAERLGVDAGTLQVLSEQQHQLRHLPPTNLYPPSRSSSSSSVDDFGDDYGDEEQWSERA